MDSGLIMFQPEKKRAFATNRALARLRPNEAADDPHRLARLYLGERCTHADGLTLRFWRGEWYRWDGSAYRTLPEKELRAELTVSTKAEMDRSNLIAQANTGKGKRPPTV